MVWRDMVLDILRRLGCATVSEIARELGVEDTRYLRLLLHRLVKRGVIVRKTRGFYCFPTT